MPRHDQPICVERWRVTQQHGRVPALNMAGLPIRYEAVPMFWTIQYVKRLDYIGQATDWEDIIIIHGDLEKPEFRAYYVNQATSPPLQGCAGTRTPPR